MPIFAADLGRSLQYTVYVLFRRSYQTDDSRQLDGLVVSITYLHYILDGTNG
jgi:hypothetical protein